MQRFLSLIAILIAVAPALTPSARADQSGLTWHRWSDALFDRAARENKYILLHMAAVWCHWCHVMERTTYRDPAIQRRLAERFIAVRVDQDSDPELSYRYENWGSPATIMFDKDGNEIFKRRGYISPELFDRLITAVIEDPSALPEQRLGVEVPPSVGGLSAARRAQTETLIDAAHDKINGGFGNVHRFIHGDTVEWALERGRTLARNAEPAPWRAMALRTLSGATRLIDPVWGGIYQYADRPDWSGAHFEKLLNIQRDAIRTYVLAWQIEGDPAHLAAAREVARWLTAFMRDPSGAFYVSQDADASPELPGGKFYALPDAARRAGPQPPIDRSLYARETGWAAASLAALYDVTGDAALLDAARAAVAWALAHRRAPGGGMGHAQPTDADTHLGDTLAIAEAALALHRSTAERRYLSIAGELAAVILRDHTDPAGGFMVRVPTQGARGALARPVRQIDENMASVRLLNLLHRYTGRTEFRAGAEHGMRYLISLAEDDLIVPGALLADRELSREPTHVTIVGAKDDPAARRLYEAARRYPTRYLRIEWWDRREGPLALSDVEYPELEEAAAFACANGLCSIPVTEPTEVHRIVSRVDDR
ncbi:MAG: thioredoxin domain-containing protein [Alphaproteobacteria bacterium]|nr:thioredoxin domain-containing protein [Alphaproteobacteria bacterium]